MAKYIFLGTLHPTRLPFNITNVLHFEQDVPLLDDRFVLDQGSLEIRNGKFQLTLETTETPVHIPTLKIRAEEIIRGIVDFCGYVSGFVYFIDIESVAEDHGNPRRFGMGAKEIADDRPQRPVQELAQYALILAKEPSLPRILGELRNSIMFPNDTAFHCYRAIETIRGYFDRRLGLKESDDRARAWRTMREALRFDRSYIQAIQDSAETQRHGKRRPMTAEQRVEAMLHTWNVVDRFIVYIDRGFQILPDADYTQLS
ncbi:MAG: hypothetical protein Q7K03_10485 [Dehalococcoidia bacterium]|nr:hypothetical protein [Dehalococcoidia bacterium]